MEAREALEPALAGLAAQHRTKADLAEIAAAIRAGDAKAAQHRMARHVRSCRPQMAQVAPGSIGVATHGDNS